MHVWTDALFSQYHSPLASVPSVLLPVEQKWKSQIFNLAKDASLGHTERGSFTQHSPHLGLGLWNVTLVCPFWILNCSLLAVDQNDLSSFLSPFQHICSIKPSGACPIGLMCVNIYTTCRSYCHLSKAISNVSSKDINHALQTNNKRTLPLTTIMDFYHVGSRADLNREIAELFGFVGRGCQS